VLSKIVVWLVFLILYVICKLLQFGLWIIGQVIRSVVYLIANVAF
jgi:hypothetical protein